LVRIDGRPSLVMKRVNGESWDERLEESWFQERFELHHEIQRLVDVCDAVAFAHSRGVLHLDLKPANVMCGAFGETLVMDWGCAALFDDRQWSDQPDLPRTKNITRPFGTPAFMAPELARGEGSALGPHTDIYLLGAILHLLLSGSPLWMGTTVRATIEMAAQGERQPLPETAPSQLAQLCRQATAPDITNRLTDISHFRDTLRHWLETRESRLLTEKALETLCDMERSDFLSAAQRQEGTQLLGVFEQAGRSGMQLPQAIEGEWRMRKLLAQTALNNGDPGVARILAMPMPPQMREPVQKQAQELHEQQSNATASEAWLNLAMSEDAGLRIEPCLLRIQMNQRLVLGEEHPDTLMALQNVSALYQKQGNFDVALQLLNRVLNVHLKTLGAAHRTTLNVQYRIGWLLNELGNFSASLSLLQQTLERQTVLLGQEHLDTLNTVYALASTYVDVSRFDEAETLYKDALSVRRRLFGEEHVDTVWLIARLAQIYQLRGRYDDAVRLSLQAYKIRVRDLGLGRRETAL